jgi:ribosomal protein S18 acetylase RimI-like enzyme
VVAETVVVRACEDRDLPHFHRFGPPDHVQYCRNEFSHGADALTILVAVDAADEPIGKLHLGFETRAAKREAVLVAAAVTRRLRGRGIGTQLMRAAEDAVCGRGYSAIVLGVEDSNPRARRLYERLGYEAVGTDNFVYQGAPDPNPGVWMRKELEC